MSKWLVYIDVNDEKIVDVANQYPDDPMDVETLIYQELGWVIESGIHVENIKSISDD